MTAAVDPGPGRSLAVGAALWLGFAFLFLVLQGTTLDEALVPAQLITNAVRYPAGHPYGLYYKEAYSLLHYLAAAVYSVVPNLTFVAGVFNVAFLFTTAFVPFAVATVLTGRATWGYLTSILVVAGLGVILQWRYPMYVFPAYFSNGHIGSGLAVLTIVLVIGGCWRWAGLAVGILPAVHGAMAALVWPWAALYLAFAAGKPRAGDRRRFVIWAGAGLLVCAGLAAITLYQRGQGAVAPPYVGEGSSAEIYRDFTLRADFHRHLFSIVSPGFLLNPVAFALLGALAWIRGDSGGGSARSRTGWILAFGAMAFAVALGAWLYRSGVGLLPRPVEMLMPFRFSNLTAALNLPLGMVVAAFSWPRLDPGSRRLAACACVTLLVATVVGVAAAPALVRGYFLFGWWLLLGSLVLLGPRTRLETLLGVALGALGLAAAVAAALRNGEPVVVGAALAAGLASTAVARRWVAWGGASRIDGLVPPTLTAAGAAVLVAAAVQYRPVPAFIRSSSFEGKVTEWLARNAAPSDLILPAALPLTKLQPKTGHPILADWETLYIIAYMPRLAPAVRVLMRDAYGLDIGDPGQLDARCPGGWVSPGTCQGFGDAWKKRTPEEWRALRRKYDLRFVMSRVPLSLPAVVPGPEWTLYSIPDADGSTAPVGGLVTAIGR